MTQQVVLVNEADEAMGTLSVEAAHDGEGHRHRAFMVFIRNRRGEILLCRRSEKKRLWAGHWENSCSSHPAWGEYQHEAGERRTREELGIDITLEPVGAFEYRAVDGMIGAEYEVCTVLTEIHEGEVDPDPYEVAECCWVELETLLVEKEPSPQAPWLLPGLQLLARYLNTSQTAQR